MVGAASVALALMLTACGDDGDGNSGGGTEGDSTGVTADTIKIGSHYPLTGPAAPGYSKIGPAAKAYFDYVNSKGGVNGRKIEFTFKDDAYNPANTVQVTRELVLQDKVFAIMGGLGTPTHTKVVDFLNQSKVPDLFVASGCLCWNEPDKHPYTFGWQPDYYVEGKVLGQYIRDNLAGKKVAYFAQNDDFGEDGTRGLDEFIPKEQVVTRQTYQPGNTNIGPQVTAIAQSGAEVVVSFSIPAYAALLKLGTVKAGINPQLVISNVGSDPVTLGGLLESFAKQGGATVSGTQLLEGIISDRYLPGYLGPEAETSSWIKLFKQVHDQYIKDLPFDGNVLYGMAAAYTFAEALKGAGDDPTRDSLVAAVEAGLSPGPGLVPFGYSDSSHEGFTGAQIGVIKNGAIELTGTPATTDTESGPIEGYDQEQAEAPEDGIPAD
jgi:ABC-type branched-subunit amino acid transport system substrate-binding protein